MNGTPLTNREGADEKTVGRSTAGVEGRQITR